MHIGARVSPDHLVSLPPLSRWFGRVMRRKHAAGNSPAAIPDKQRVYAVGDIHGRSDLLASVLAKIEGHIGSHPIEVAKIIFLGDYVDRGPNTVGVIDMLSNLSGDSRFVFLKGNHEAFMLAALEDRRVLSDWLWAGGRETLQSYGVTVPMRATADDLQAALSASLEAIPPHHVGFLNGLQHKHVVGDYVFVHAGLRPGVPLGAQSSRDLMSIREEFLQFSGSHGYVVVHGHTPVETPDIKSNRVNIDTGAYITGNLTCAVFEGTEISFI